MAGVIAQRGELRILLLWALREGELSPGQVKQKITDATNGAYRPGPGGVHRRLDVLEMHGLVEQRRISPRLRLFRLTESGHLELKEQVDFLEATMKRLEVTT